MLRVNLTAGVGSAKFEGVIHGGIFTFGRWLCLASLGIALFFSFPAPAQTARRQFLHGHVPAAVSRLAAQGRLPAATNLFLTIGLPLRNEAALDELLRQLYDPASANFHKFLTPQEFTARFGPTEQDYQAVIQFAETNSLAVAGTSGNRMVLDVEGSVSNIERAFQVTLRTFRHPAEARDFFAPDTEPSVPSDLSVADVWGLSDFGRPHPLLHRVNPLRTQPLSGSGPDGYYAGNDFRNAYAPGTPLTGTGQAVGLLEFSAYYKVDITNYENTIRLTNYAAYVALTNVVLPGGTPSTANNDEVALDIEMAIAMAPGLSRVIVYEIKSVNPSSILSRMANDNLAKQLSSSWTWSGGPSTTVDSAFKQMASQGQSFFQAAGDNDAYTGSQTLDNSNQITAPVDSTNITTVGGTTLYMNGSGVSWSSETVWNYNSYGGSYANVGSGGGISTYYTIPYWQTNVSMTANSGSTTFRNIPDVALTADQIYGAYGNGTNGGFAGTSCAAPLWAGLCALINQQSVASSGTTAGFLNPALYAIGNGTNYAACFHDITTGNNIGTNTPGLFNAVSGYDLCTGWGTPNGTELINTLAPPGKPYFLTQPSGQTVTNGSSLSLGATVLGQPPFSYQWLFNGTNLPAGGNVSGNTSNILSITAATTNNSGDYSLVVTNNYASVTSGVAVLIVGFAPVFSAQPSSLTILSGGNAVFSTVATGSAPLVYQWQKNGTNVSNGAGISGATSNVLTLTAVTTNSNGGYSLAVTNHFGVSTSSVATLTVVLPPSITSSSLTNRTVQCGSNSPAFTVTATGTPPLNYQWSFDGAPVSNATNASFSLVNVHLPNHTVGVAVTNFYGSVASNAVLTVQDTIAPVITLYGANPFYVELGSTFADPGATAADLCMGVVPVTVSGSVNTNVVGTNTLTYTATDDGNTSMATRTVIVHDTTPPTILWSYTNLVLAAGTNCSTAMPNVTGTNFIIATDLSEPLTISQTPTNTTILPLGTNVVVITVNDLYDNAAYSTNTITVEDQTPPMIWSQPQNQTNCVGGTANFSVTAAACTPLSFQWFFNNAMLAAQTGGTLTLTNISPASAGNYSVVVTASGGSTTSAVATLTVNLFSTSLALNSSANPDGFKDDLNFTAAIAPTNATGAIQFYTNGAAFDLETLIAGQAASVSFASLPRGTNLITAIYSGDADDLSATNMLAQIVTNHPPTAADAFYSRLAGYPLNIAVADLATNWSDADGDTVSLAGIGVSADGVTVTNNAGTLVYFDTNNVDDQFVCTISDGWGGTNFQTVHIAIVLTDTVPNIVGVGSASFGTVTLSLGGAPGYTYVLETTTNLDSPDAWQPAATNTLGADGVWQFTDMEATNYPNRFYRLKLQQ